MMPLIQLFSLISKINLFLQFRFFDAEIRTIRKLIRNTVFSDILRTKAEKECDEVFLQRLKSNPKALKMSFWENHFELKALMNYPEISGNILDFGCGSGHMDVCLARKGMLVHGIDMSPIGIGIAKSLLAKEPFEVKERLSFQKVDVTKPRTDSFQFDACWSSHVFEHIKDPLPILKGLRAWLKPRAFILLTVPRGAHFDDPGHVHHFFREEDLIRHLEPILRVKSVQVSDDKKVFRALCRFAESDLM